MRQVFPISMKQMQFIRYFRFIVDVPNIEMNFVLHRNISKARVFNTAREFGVEK
jgi:hypothetical protein